MGRELISEVAWGILCLSAIGAWVYVGLLLGVG